MDQQLIQINENKCRICYSCVRACPVKAIKVTKSGSVPVVDEELCIGCGNCVHACTPGAIEYRKEKDQVKYFLRNEPTIALLDPSISCEFSDISDYRKLTAMLKFIGFKEIYETAFAVDLLAQSYARLFNDFRGKYYITANCPAIVAYVEKFQPSLINNLAPLVTPMTAMSRVLRTIKNASHKIVFIGPCIAAKEEAKLFGEKDSVDAVLTFEELRELFAENTIQENMVEFADLSEPTGYLGYLYPIPEGIIEAGQISKSLIDNIVVTGSGKRTSIQYLKAFEQNGDEINCHFNLFICKGCMMGPGCANSNSRLKRRQLTIQFAQKRIKQVNYNHFVNWLNQTSGVDLSRQFHVHYQQSADPSEEKIKSILQGIEKFVPQDEVNCSACGYDTCRDFATAVAKGLTIPEMCLTYSMKKQQNYIASLRQTNEKLSLMQEALIESERKAKLGQELAQDASETINAMLQKLRAGIVMIDHKLKIVRANQSFIELLGNDAREIAEVVPGLEGADIKTLLPYSFYHLINYVLESNEEVLNKDVQVENGLLNISVFPIKKGKIVGAIVRDMYRPEFRKEEIINRLNEVIEKNLDMVQKIGYLLGEGASETEQMLNTIIQAFKTRDEK